MALHPISPESSDVALDAHDQTVAIAVTTDWDMGYGLVNLSTEIESVGIYLNARDMLKVAAILTSEANLMLMREHCNS